MRNRTTAGHAHHYDTSNIGCLGVDACSHRHDPSNPGRPGSDASAHLDRLAQASDGRPQNRRTEGVVPGFGRSRSNPRFFDGRPG